MAFSLSSICLRAIPGAYIASSGIEKLSLDEQSAGFLKSMAAKGFPIVNQLDDATFGKALAASEIAVGGALLAPFVNNKLAGLALGAFAGGMLTMYFKTPEFTQEDGIRPSQEGIAVSHNVFLASIAGALITRVELPKVAKKVLKGGKKK